MRDDIYQTNIRGLYPCGEGAGYAGGIVSAAVDGMKCAHAVLGDEYIKRLLPFSNSRCNSLCFIFFKYIKQMY